MEISSGIVKKNKPYTRWRVTTIARIPINIITINHSTDSFFLHITELPIAIPTIKQLVRTTTN